VYPRVLHCLADYKWTGPSGPVVRLCADLSERGWVSDLACMAAPPGVPNLVAQRAGEAGVRCLEVFRPHGAWSLREALRARRRLREAADADYGIIHFHGGWDQFIGVLAGSRRTIPTVRTDHGARQYAGGLLERRFYGPRNLDHLIVLSERHVAQALERLRRAPGTVSAVRGAIDVRAFQPADPPDGLRARLGFGEGDVVIGLVARVQRHRRFDVLLRAAQTVARRNPCVRIAVCGRGTHREELLDRPVLATGLGGTVLPLGYRSDDYADVLATFDAGMMLMPGSDGSCRAAMEMAAMGKPLVVAGRGVLPDIVLDGRTGIVVDDTPGQLAEAILEMAADGERRRAWGAAARQRMCDLFSTSRQAQEVIQVYRTVLGAS